MWTKVRCSARRFIFISVSLLGFALSASAQERHAGVRAGISADPEQVYFGFHADLAEVAPRFWFRPNAEFGFGDRRTVVSLNGEFVYLIPVRSSEWTPYFGGGPALVVQNFRGGNTDVGPGFNFVAGIQQRRGLLAEVKIGAIDSPGFKLGIGWTW